MNSAIYVHYKVSKDVWTSKVFDEKLEVTNMKYYYVIYTDKLDKKNYKCAGFFVDDVHCKLKILLKSLISKKLKYIEGIVFENNKIHMLVDANITYADLENLYELFSSYDVYKGIEYEYEFYYTQSTRDVKIGKEWLLTKSYIIDIINQIDTAQWHSFQTKKDYNEYKNLPSHIKMAEPDKHTYKYTTNYYDVKDIGILKKKLYDILIIYFSGVLSEIVCVKLLFLGKGAVFRLLCMKELDEGIKIGIEKKLNIRFEWTDKPDDQKMLIEFRDMNNIVKKKSNELIEKLNNMLETVVYDPTKAEKSSEKIYESVKKFKLYYVNGFFDDAENTERFLNAFISQITNARDKYQIRALSLTFWFLYDYINDYFCKGYDLVIKKCTEIITLYNFEDEKTVDVIQYRDNCLLFLMGFHMYNEIEETTENYNSRGMTHMHMEKIINKIIDNISKQQETDEINYLEFTSNISLWMLFNKSVNMELSCEQCSSFAFNNPKNKYLEKIPSQLQNILNNMLEIN